MVIFRRTQGPVGGVISGGKGPIIPFPLQNKEVSRVKININLIKIDAGLNKVKKEVKVLQKVIYAFTRSL